ncbi:MAG: type II toxin-antitoxin system VapC family toxin [Candidatus Geothermincolia bacterium]
MIYVDTSVIVALLTTEPKTQDVTAWYAGLRDTPSCSDWLLTEFSSALSIKLRAGQINEANAKRVRKEFTVLAEGGLRIVPVSRGAFGHAAEIVKLHGHGLRAGDALHLAVALELGASHTATLDGTLAANAKRNGMKLIEF